MSGPTNTSECVKSPIAHKRDSMWNEIRLSSRYVFGYLLNRIDSISTSALTLFIKELCYRIGYLYILAYFSHGNHILGVLRCHGPNHQCGWKILHTKYASTKIQISHSYLMPCFCCFICSRNSNYLRFGWNHSHNCHHSTVVYIFVHYFAERFCCRCSFHSNYGRLVSNKFTGYRGWSVTDDGPCGLCGWHKCYQHVA